MSDFAIIENSGKQFFVTPSMIIQTDELSLSESKTVTYDKVLLVCKADKITLGQPYIKDHKIKGSVIGIDKGPKVDTNKFKAKSRYRKSTGHRQKYLAVEIKSI